MEPQDGLDLSKPGPRQPPLEIARDTFLVRALTASIGGTWTNLNAMVIRGAEPVVVDTGMATMRDLWFEDLFAIVAPDALRWIFITHIDCDHAGNLVETLERCPQARLVISRGESYRAAAAFGISFDRMTLIDHGQSFPVGDRELLALRPPVYDSPYTRGVFDPTTGVYYAADAFCAPNPAEPVDWVEQIPDGQWKDSMARFHHSALCPWITLVDRARFRAEVDRLAALDIHAIASAHSPAIGAAAVGRALAHMAALPDTAG